MVTLTVLKTIISIRIGAKIRYLEIVLFSNGLPFPEMYFLGLRTSINRGVFVGNWFHNYVTQNSYRHNPVISGSPLVSVPFVETFVLV